jgi:NAD(P)H dehydrogenase (quinone)
MRNSVILVTGAAGKTGKAVIQALSKKGERVRALVRLHEQIDIVMTVGATQAIVGDQQDMELVRKVCRGVQAIYLICPNMNPDEVKMGEEFIHAAQQAGVERFIYHSVLHPQIEKMPHHWLKMRVEEMIFESGLDFTILQPAAYMENILPNWKMIDTEGIYSVPYALESRLSIVALADVAEVAASVLTQSGHQNTVYELAGPQALTQLEVAEILTREFGRPVVAKVIDRDPWERNARSSNMPEYTIQTLLKMFVYYENYGLIGNARVLSNLLGRKPTQLAEFIRDAIQKNIMS